MLLPDHIQKDPRVEISSYATAQEGLDHSLVVLALGENCWLVPLGSTYRLLVEATAAERVRKELTLYDRESHGWPPIWNQPVVTVSGRFDLVTPLLWAGVVLAVYRGQLLNPQWTDAGSLDAVAVWRQGEFWRAFTALFLHGNSAHLVANLFSGVFVFAAVLSVMGRVRGWLLLGLAGMMGNLLNSAAHYPDEFHSLGASTAIFGAVGLLTGRALRATFRKDQPRRWRNFFLPLATGLTVLALYGAGGPEVDVMAHVTGFGSGVVLGIIFSGSRTLLRP
ncbi:MAG: rhomboid family intramembrane serine protease [Cephaloticoccus sp.]|nr:rhomboid family intramembrane serine protease [Cephaloticoccus sp.]MCF7761030.1 rhomboid family intramembrane serine protease [Cephaloticoccus sp.]